MFQTAKRKITRSLKSFKSRIKFKKEKKRNLFVLMTVTMSFIVGVENWTVLQPPLKVKYVFSVF